MNTHELETLTPPQQLLHWARTRPDAVALRQKEFGIWQPVSWREYAERSGCLALALLQLGLRTGEKVAILGENRIEWVIAQSGVGLAGGIVAGVYPTSPGVEIEYLLQLAGSPIIVCEDQEHGLTKQRDKPRRSGRGPALSGGAAVVFVGMEMERRGFPSTIDPCFAPTDSNCD